MQKISHFCGIDVSKQSFAVAIKNGTFLVKNRSFGMNKVGFDEFENLIKSLKNSLLIGMESTGVYHNNLLGFLNNRGYNTIVVNPYMVHQFFKFNSHKPTKTDQKDAKTICDFIELKRDESRPSQMGRDEPMAEKQLKTEAKTQMKYLVREKEEIVYRIAQTKTEIRRILSLVFPEIERETGLFSQELISLLAEFSSAHSIRSISKKEFIQRGAKIVHKNRGRKNSLTLEKIYELAHSSIAQSHSSYEELLKMKLKRLLLLIEEKEHITQLIDKAADESFSREIEILTSIPGIGRESAIYLMAEIVDIKRFSGYRKLIGFCGLDPVIKQSGKFKASWRISKKGNSHARRIIWIMGGCVKRSCPYFRSYYLKKRNEGKSYKEAVIATSTKLLRTIYALLNEGRCFK